MVTLLGPGGRGGAFMDHTDDSVIDVTYQARRLTPGATYRLAATTNDCAAGYVKALRVFGTTLTADARGTRWVNGEDVVRVTTDAPGALRVLKGASGSTQVACGVPTPVTDDVEHPAVSQLLISRSTGAQRKGSVFAREVAEGQLGLTVALEPGAKPADIDSFRIGAVASAFTPQACASTTLFGVADF